MIRRATHSDLEAIMTIVHSAQLYLAELGIDQWQDGYPEREVIVADIDTGVGSTLTVGASSLVHDTATKEAIRINR